MATERRRGLVLRASDSESNYNPPRPHLTTWQIPESQAIVVRKSERSRIHLVRFKQEQPESPFFRVGEAVPYTGVYRVFHAEHRVSHDVVLFADNAFPRCNKCGSDVHFELILCATEQRSTRTPFQLYEIPHPDENSELEAAS